MEHVINFHLKRLKTKVIQYALDYIGYALVWTSQLNYDVMEYSNRGMEVSESNRSW
jgi:hypothetical protein